MANSAIQDDSTDLNAVLERFIALNDARLDRVQATLAPQQAEFLHLLPLLFHTNHPALPGYSSRDTPAGISGYYPTDEAIAAAGRLGRSFRFLRDSETEVPGVPQEQAPILGLYIMGSLGSIAYSTDSDFDVWVCHDPDLESAALASLRTKAEQVGEWAARLGLEVHFFLVNPAKYRRGEIQRLSAESSGSAQYRLLLDEFYRTGLHIAGRYPMWWCVPPEHEADYDRYVERLRQAGDASAADLLDLGGLSQVSAEEFLGAAIWQLCKGIDSPYKSVLKLFLIEAYAREYPELDLLSFRFKRAVYAGEQDLDRLDSYLMMLTKVEQYLGERGEHERRDLARRCFYFKIGEKLTTDETSSVQWRRRLLEQRVRDWGWSRDTLVELDRRDSWKVSRVAKERHVLFEALSASYRFLSGFARRYEGSAMITREDLTVLGRKLYAAYERKAGKVELVSRGNTSALVESQLSLHEALDEEGRSTWVLYRGNLKPTEVRQEVALKRTRTVTEMVAWSFFNGVLDRQTLVTVYGRESTFSTRQMRAMINRMHELFPEGLGDGGTMEDFARPAQARRCVIFVNTGHDPLVRGELPSRRLASARTDPLSYGGMAQNLVVSLDPILISSWLEVQASRFAGEEGVMDCLCEFLKWNPPGSSSSPVDVTVTSVSATKAASLSRRIQDLFADVMRCYYGGEYPPATRYVLRIGRCFYALYFEKDGPRYDRVGGYEALLHYLGSQTAKFRDVVFDPYALDDSLLPMIYKRNRAGYVQFFYRPMGAEVEMFVLDERGSLFHRRTSYHSTRALLSHYGRFFEAALNRMNFLMEGQSQRAPEGVEFFAIQGDGGALTLSPQSPDESAANPYLSLQVIMDVDDEGSTSFTLYCNGREFSSLEMGSDVFDAAVRYVLELRKSGKRYPVYITDISMSPLAVGKDALGKIQTVNFLAYKHRIEEKLDRALARFPGPALS